MRSAVVARAVDSELAADRAWARFAALRPGHSEHAVSHVVEADEALRRAGERLALPAPHADALRLAPGGYLRSVRSVARRAPFTQERPASVQGNAARLAFLVRDRVCVVGRTLDTGRAVSRSGLDGAAAARVAVTARDCIGTVLAQPHGVGRERHRWPRGSDNGPLGQRASDGRVRDPCCRADEVDGQDGADEADANRVDGRRRGSRAIPTTTVRGLANTNTAVSPDLEEPSGGLGGSLAAYPHGSPSKQSPPTAAAINSPPNTASATIGHAPARAYSVA